MRKALPVLLLVLGCGASATDVARATLTTTAHATVAADRLFADAYELASTDARDTSATQAEKDAKMVDWEAAADKIEGALSAIYAALATAEVALDALDRGEPGSFDEAFACAAASLREAAGVLQERGLKIPLAVTRALALSESLVCAGAVR
jgi:hypothetical protein